MTTDITYGVVLYTDGGCGPTNPGNVGGGYHGYLFNNTVPKTGAGLDTHILTADGYRSKPSTDQSITPISYIDGVVCLEWGSNNIAELIALTYGIEAVLALCAEYTITKAIFQCDSKYTVDGVNQWSKTWIKNNWRKIDGTEVANQDYWKKLLANVSTLRMSGVEVEFKHVYGHDDGKDDSFGNNIADYLATVGKTRVLNNFDPSKIVGAKPTNAVVISAGSGYWKLEFDKSPFISQRTL